MIKALRLSLILKLKRFLKGHIATTLKGDQTI